MVGNDQRFCRGCPLRHHSQIFLDFQISINMSQSPGSKRLCILGESGGDFNPDPPWNFVAVVEVYN